MESDRTGQLIRIGKHVRLAHIQSSLVTDYSDITSVHMAVWGIQYSSFNVDTDLDIKQQINKSNQ